MKRMLTTVVLFALSVLSFAAPKEADAVYNRIVREYTLNPDGSQTMRVVKDLTYKSYPAIHSFYGEDFIDYDPEYQELIINSSYTRLPNGTVVMTPENAFVEVLPDYAADAPAYNHLRRMVVVHTALEIGATAFLDYSIVSKEDYLPELDILVDLEEKIPVTEYNIVVSVPQDKDLRFSSTIAGVSPVETAAEGMSVYTWKFKNLQATPYEPGVRSRTLLAATTFVSQDEAFGFIVPQLAKASDIDSATLAKLRIDGSDADKAAAVDKFLFERIVRCAVMLPQASFRVRPAREILASALATSAEYASLRAALMEAVGVKCSVNASYALEGFGLAGLTSLSAKTTMEQDITRKSGNYAISLEYGSDVLKNGYAVVEMPFEKGAFNGAMYSRFPTARKSDLRVEPVRETYTYTVVLKDGIRVCGLAFLNQEISNAAGYYSCKASLSGNVLTLVRSIDIYESVIQPADYAAFHSLVSAWAVPCGIILTQK